MRSTIDLMNIKPAPAENPRRGVPAPLTLMSSFRVPAIHIAGGGDSDYRIHLDRWMLVFDAVLNTV